MKTLPRRLTKILLGLFLLIFSFSTYYSSASAVAITDRGEWDSSVVIYESGSASATPIQLFDFYGRILALFGYGGRFIAGRSEFTGLLYAERGPDGIWSGSIKLPAIYSDPNVSLPDLVESPTAVQDDQGGIHLVWSFRTIYSIYIYKPAGGSWTEPIKIDPLGGRFTARLGKDGTLYLIGNDKFTTRSLSGEWSSHSVPQNLVNFIVDSSGNIYGLTSSISETGFVNKPAGQGWGAIIPLNPSGGILTQPTIILDYQENIHFVWLQKYQYDCFPTICNAYSLVYRAFYSGNFTDTTELANSLQITSNFSEPIFTALPVGDQFHVFWNQSNTTFHRILTADWNWSTVETLSGTTRSVLSSNQGDIYRVAPFGFRSFCWCIPRLGWSGIFQNGPTFLSGDDTHTFAITLGAWQKPAHSLDLIYSQYSTTSHSYLLYFRQFNPKDYYDVYLPSVMKNQQ